jgi:arginyl-tRNA synthetase
MNYLELINKEIDIVLTENLRGRINYSVEMPDLIHGDATSNVCLVAAKTLGKSPREVFAILEKNLEKSLLNLCEKIEFKEPGFINFWLKKEFVRKGGKLVGEKSLWENICEYFFRPNQNSPYTCGLGSQYFGKKVLVEHSSPNLFKPFTIGHLMNNFTGEFLVRLMKEAGAKVTTVSFPSDISIGIAKAIYILKKDGGLDQKIFQGDRNLLVKYLGDCYVRGVSLYSKALEEGDEKVLREVKDVANNLFEGYSSEDLKIYNSTRKVNLDYLFGVLENLGSHFDGFIFESESGRVGKKIVLEQVGKVFEKSEGAIIYRPEESRKDLNVSVFINSEGNPTYEAKDIGLLDLKFKKYSPDFSFFVTDNEQAPHFKVTLDAAGKIKKEWQEKSFFVPHGRMTFRGQKMSSRLGGVPTAEEVVDTIFEAVKEKSGERQVSEEIQREIALAALRISVLRAKPGVNIDFDPDKALSFEGDSGPYLCYTSARMHSLLQKGKENGLYPGCQLAHSGTERNLERKVLQFENILATVIDELAPQKLVTYLFELGGEFNHFYNNTKVISENPEDKFESEHYLYVVQKTLNVLTKGLYILGINAPEKM